MPRIASSSRPSSSFATISTAGARPSPSHSTSRGTEFQKQVWTALLAIPYGESRSYGDIARAIGRPKAVRAVGAAAGKNPIAVVAPCHRVLGSTGTLTGFAGGLTAKTRLLAIEGLRNGRSGPDAKPIATDRWTPSLVA